MTSNGNAGKVVHMDFDPYGEATLYTYEVSSNFEGPPANFYVCMYMYAVYC